MLLAAVIWGTMGAFARWSALSPLELSFFRLVSATLALFFLLPREQRFSYFYSTEYGNRPCQPRRRLKGK
ncbi:MAG: EamA family transporter [Dethiobacteria bacterium]